MSTNHEGKRDYAKYRAKGQAGYLTRSLFADVMEAFVIPGSEEAPFWLERNYLGDNRPVMREHFLLSMDPTGYKTAIEFLGCYEHWEVLVSRCSWFRNPLERWTREVKARQKASAIEKIMEIALGESSQSLAAAKYIATADYDKLDGRGRPTSAELKGELKRQVKIAEEEADDMARIGLN